MPCNIGLGHDTLHYAASACGWIYIYMIIVITRAGGGGYWSGYVEAYHVNDLKNLNMRIC